MEIKFSPMEICQNFSLSLSPNSHAPLVIYFSINYLTYLPFLTVYETIELLTTQFSEVKL